MDQGVLLTGFGDYLQYEKRYSPHTCEGYARDISSFSDYLLKQYGDLALTGVSHQHLRSWVVSLLGEKTKAVSIRRKLSALSHFYKWSRKKGYIQHNPMTKVQLPKVPSRLPSSLPESNIEKVWQWIGERDNARAYPGLRDKAILGLLYGSGLRRSELIELTWNEVDEQRASIRVLGKGKKYRQVPVHKSVIGLLGLLRNEANTTFDHALTDHVILTDSGKPCYPKFVYNKVVAFLSLVTTSEKKSPHVLRHSMATHLMDHGAELNAVKEILGHSSLAATQVYTHNAIHRLKEVYEKSHPSAGKK